MGTEKAVEYKDTFTFRLFPEYKYTRTQQRRFRFFQGRVEHWKKAINYADSFKDSNRINLLYMIGYDTKMRAYIEKNTDNVIVLCTDIPRQLLKKYDAYWDLMQKYKSRGYVDENGNLNHLYAVDRAARDKRRGAGAMPVDIFAADDAVIDEYQNSIAGQIADCFGQYIMIDRSGKERAFSIENLDSLIKQRFPYGRELCGVGESAYNSLKKIDDALEAGLTKSDASKILCLPSGASSYDACKKGIRRCQMDLSVALRENGVVNLCAMMERMAKPPYGWDNDPHAAYCFGYAVSDYLDDGWLWDEKNCFPAKKAAQSFLRTVLRGDSIRHAYHLIMEPSYKLSAKLSYLFGVSGDGYIPKDEIDNRILAMYLSGESERRISNELGTMSNIAVHKRIAKMKARTNENTTLSDMSMKVCKKIEDNTRWPIALLDSRLRNILVGEWDKNRHISVLAFGKRKESAEVSYLTPEKCKELKKKIGDINVIVPEMIRQRYGSDVDIQEIERCCTAPSSGWLWEEGVFWKSVEAFLGGEICGCRREN